MPRWRKASESSGINSILCNALRDNNQDRLLWFARTRAYMIKAPQGEVGRGIKVIIGRFQKEGLKNPRSAHWLLNILEMCVIHCTEEFVMALNDQNALQPFVNALTIKKFHKQYDEVVRLKLVTLLKSWHEKFKDFWPDSAFKKIYEAGNYSDKSSPLRPVNLHWFPNRDLLNKTLDAFLYDIAKVGNELLEHNHRSLSNLNILCADAEHSSSKKCLGNFAVPQDLQKMAHTILRQVEADLRFWEDIVHHVDIPDESLPGIVAIGDNIRKVKPDVEQILETLKTAGHSSSRSVDEGFGLETDALILEGGYQSPESQSAHPLTQVAPACMVDGDNASQTNASTVQDSVACQILTTKDPKPRSSHADSSSKISQMDMVSTAGSQDHTANAFDYETILQRYRHRMVDNNSGSQGDLPAFYENQVVKDQEHSQPNASIDKNTSASGYPVLNSANREGKQQTDSLLANWLCPICQIGFQEKQEYITHRSSAKHKTNVAALPPLPTDVKELNKGISSPLPSSTSCTTS